VDLIGDADLAGFNSNRFDIVMLMEEFNRAGVEFDMSNRKTIDVLRIFHKLEKRDLKSAYKFYCSKELEGAHNAMNDVKATLEVLEAQLDRYKNVEILDGNDNKIVPIKNDMQALQDFTNDPDELDFQGKIKLNAEGIPCLTFGKFQNQPLAFSLAGDSKYFQWILNSEFSSDTKKIITKLVNEFKEQNK
jgi:DNA polymerase-3 subunit epsilon